MLWWAVLVKWWSWPSSTGIKRQSILKNCSHFILRYRLWQGHKLPKNTSYKRNLKFCSALTWLKKSLKLIWNLQRSFFGQTLSISNSTSKSWVTFSCPRMVPWMALRGPKRTPNLCSSIWPTQIWYTRTNFLCPDMAKASSCTVSRSYWKICTALTLPSTLPSMESRRASPSISLRSFSVIKPNNKM